MHMPTSYVSMHVVKVQLLLKVKQLYVCLMTLLNI